MTKNSKLYRDIVFLRHSGHEVYRGTPGICVVDGQQLTWAETREMAERCRVLDNWETWCFDHVAGKFSAE